jgi:large subunit ribosomal protein L15
LPKRGFSNINSKSFTVINLSTLQAAVEKGVFKAGDTVDQASLQAAGLIKGVRDGVRLLAKGELSTKLTIVVSGASKNAVEAVEKAGGSVTVLFAATDEAAE